MRSSWKPAILVGCAAIALSARAPAQNIRPPASLHDPQQLLAERGQVQQFTLTPRRDIQLSAVEAPPGPGRDRRPPPPRP